MGNETLRGLIAHLVRESDIFRRAFAHLHRASRVFRVLGCTTDGCRDAPYHGGGFYRPMPLAIRVTELEFDDRLPAEVLTEVIAHEFAHAACDERGSPLAAGRRETGQQCADRWAGVIMREVGRSRESQSAVRGGGSGHVGHDDG